MSSTKGRARGKLNIVDEAVPKDPKRFYNRELSWLQFNRRVLEEAQNIHHPLLERLRFLSISASNLDEFYMVRVAGLHGQVVAKVQTVSQDGLTAEQQLHAINRFVAGLSGEQQGIWTELKAEMQKAGIAIVEPQELTSAETAWLETHFISHIFPVLTPIAIDPAHPFPFIPNRGFTVGLELAREGTKATMHALMPVPGQLERFVRLPFAENGANASAQIRFMRIELLIGHFVSRLFPGYHVTRQGAFRVLRDSDIEVEEEAEDLVRSFESALKRRRRGSVIRLRDRCVDALGAQELRDRATARA